MPHQPGTKVTKPGKAWSLRLPDLVRAAIILAIGCVLTISVAWASAIASTVHRSKARGGTNLQVGMSLITRADQPNSTLTIAKSSDWLASSARLSMSPGKPDLAANPEPAATAEELLEPWCRSLHAEIQIAAAADPGRNFRCLVNACGLPFRCLRTVYSNHWQIDSVQSPSAIGELPLPAGLQSYLTGGTPPVTVPTDPWWPGLALNVAFWSLATWSTLALAAAARRRFRQKKGLCASCGYALHGLSAAAACPECGHLRP